MGDELHFEKIANGYWQCVMPDWTSFVSYVCTDMQSYQAFVWRGQRMSAWTLVPTLTRALKGDPSDPAEFLRHAVLTQEHLDRFKLSTRGRRGKSPRVLESDDDWWALAQHHGLATPLLDWTTSPFVAAFFAFMKEDPDQTDHRAVFALHSETLINAAKSKARAQDLEIRQRFEDVRSGKVKPGLLDLFAGGKPPPKTEPELAFIHPLTDENERLVNQGGLFTRLASRVENPSLEAWLVDSGDEENRGLELIKFLIPNSEREKCLISLNRMNINHLTLFPDLGGASAHCNLALEIEGY
ncbi:FRG domain-containing protein [Roseateles sp. PN1]|uniref:FRG domain-containing protein n=1 Tax=Roseateles sp. PN1 TaxID=3137372 RepID=UPI00313880EB